MIAIVPLMLMLATAAPADAVGAGRKAFSQCLSSQIQPALEAKTSLGDFQALLKSKCAAQETAFRNAILADDKASGMTAAAAQTDADDQVSEYVDKIIAKFEEYSQPS